jgi:hypothetical protein
LPPEILDRLSRPEESDSDNEEERERKRSKIAGDRSGVNSLLDELRSAPLHKGSDSVKKSDATFKKETITSSEGLGLAFMSYTTERTTKGSGGVVDVHAAKANGEPETSTKDQEPPKATVRKPVTFTRISAAAPIPKSMQQSMASTELPSTSDYPIQSETHTQPTTATTTTYARYNPTENYPETNNLQMNSRKQRREQERSLRCGAAFQNSNGGTNTMEIHQPSPTEYAPTAHMAAIASRAAHLRNLGSIDPSDNSNYGEYGVQKAKSAGVAMYDPKTGTDVKGGVTGKHKSKHQINQLMVSAMGLEASRAGEAELARLGLGHGSGKTGGGRADAKNKYGW